MHSCGSFGDGCARYRYKALPRVLNVTDRRMKLYNYIYERIPSSLFCSLTNARNRIRNKKHRICPTQSRYLYKVTDSSNDQIIICRRKRHNLYKRGVSKRLDQLVDEYQLDLIDFKPGDVFVDCGANVGELGFWAMKNSLRYFPVEPEELEVECCNHNIFGGKAAFRSRALWKENCTLELYSKPGEGDSSLVEMNNYSTVKKIEAVTLDTFITEHRIDTIKLLKIEAEGAEPEILEGAAPVLDRVAFISVDCGPERGFDKQSTFNEVHRILTENGFEIVQANMNRIVFLYKNKSSRTE